MTEPYTKEELGQFDNFRASWTTKDIEHIPLYVEEFDRLLATARAGLEAREDVARLDWLDRRGRDIAVGVEGNMRSADFLWRGYVWYRGETVRQAIDDARERNPTSGKVRRSSWARLQALADVLHGDGEDISLLGTSRGGVIISTASHHEVYGKDLADALDALDAARAAARSEANAPPNTSAGGLRDTSDSERGGGA